MSFASAEIEPVAGTLPSFPALFVGLFGIVAACWLLALVPELAELGMPVGAAAAIVLLVAAASFPREASAPIGRLGAIGLLAAATLTPYGRDAAPDIALGAMLVIAGRTAAGTALLTACLARRAAELVPDTVGSGATWLAAAAGSLAGEEWRASGEWLFPPGGRLHCGPIAIGWPLIFAAFATFALIGVRSVRPPRVLAAGAAVAAAFIPLRLVAWAWFFPEAQPAGAAAFHWSAGAIFFLSFVPLIGLYALLLANRPLLPELAPVGCPPRASHCFLLVTGVAAAALLAPRGLVTAPLDDRRLVVIDETHSDWEPVVVEYDERTDEETRQNNYVSLARFLSRLTRVEVWKDDGGDGRPRRALDVTLSGKVAVRRERLERRSLSALLAASKEPVLVLKCPSMPYTASEVAAVVEFVEAGGNLILLGDHSDAFFMNTHLNQVAEKFGIRFLPDEHYDAFGTWIETDATCQESTSPFTPLGRFLLATNCPLETRPPAFPLIRSRFTSFAEPGDYFSPSFFGNRVVDGSDRFGSHPMMAGSRLGEGKVIAFGDSTSFNNSFWGYPDRRLLWYLWLDWTGKDRWLECPWTASWLLLAAVLWLVLAGRGRGSTALVDAFLLGAGTCWLLMPGTGPQAADTRYLDSIDAAQVVFDVSHGSRHTIGEEEGAAAPPSQGIYGTALEELASLGVNLRVTRRCAAAAEVRGAARVIVVVSPVTPFSASEVEGYRQFVQSGGRMLLIEGATHLPAMDSLARPLGLEFARSPASAQVSAAWPAPSSVYPLDAQAGSILWRFGDRSVLAGSGLGKGFVAALGDDRLAARSHDRSPSAGAMQLFRDLVRSLLEGSPRAALSALAPAATGLDISRAAAARPPGPDEQIAVRARVAQVFGKFRLVPDDPRLPAPARRLHLVSAIRRTVNSSGPLVVATSPRVDAGDSVLVVCASNAAQRLKRLRGREAERYAILDASVDAASPSTSSPAADTVLVHPSALAVGAADPAGIGRNVDRLLRMLAGTERPPERLVLMPADTLRECLGAAALVALAALGPDGLSAWYDEVAALEELDALLAGADHDRALLVASLRMARSVIPDVHLASMALAAARSGKNREAALWAEQSRMLLSLVKPLHDEVGRLLPDEGRRGNQD